MGHLLRRHCVNWPAVGSLWQNVTLALCGQGCGVDVHETSSAAASALDTSLMLWLQYEKLSTIFTPAGPSSVNGPTATVKLRFCPTTALQTKTMPQFCCGGQACCPLGNPVLL